MLAEMWASTSQMTYLDVCRIVCQIVVCVSLARIIVSDFRHHILDTLRGTAASKPTNNISKNCCKTEVNDDVSRLAVCKQHIERLRELSSTTHGDSSSSVDLLGTATDLALVLLPGDDMEVCQAMYQSVERTLQALDYGSASAVIASKRFLDTLDGKEELLAKSQVDHLKMLHETGVELDVLMSSAMERHYESSPFVRSERLADHTVTSTSLT